MHFRGMHMLVFLWRISLSFPSITVFPPAQHVDHFITSAIERFLKTAMRLSTVEVGFQQNNIHTKNMLVGKWINFHNLLGPNIEYILLPGQLGQYPCLILYHELVHTAIDCDCPPVEIPGNLKTSKWGHQRCIHMCVGKWKLYIVHCYCISYHLIERSREHLRHQSNIHSRVCIFNQNYGWQALLDRSIVSRYRSPIKWLQSFQCPKGISHFFHVSWFFYQGLLYLDCSYNVFEMRHIWDKNEPVTFYQGFGRVSATKFNVRIISHSFR